MSDPKDTKRIAMVGTGITGAACAASLQQAEALRQSVLKRAFEGKLI